jgi:quercetin dioxygenase-like cupin family protein
MSLFEAVAAYLGLYEPWSDAAEAMESASGFDAPTPDLSASSPVVLAVEQLVGSERTQPLLDALRPRMLAMPWRQNPTYTDESFLRRYAYCELLGPTGLVPHGAVSVGLLYLARGTTYPPHAHPAEEAYHLLAGESEWQAGSAPLTWRSPGDRMEHPSGVPHSMRSGPTPMLALYVWRGDLGTPAQFVPNPSAFE